jgi:hypothetical protein
LTADHHWNDAHPDRSADPGPPGPGGDRSGGWDRGFQVADPDLIAHVETRLDAEVCILRATSPQHGPVAVVGINHDRPVVYADTCTDSWYWFDADSVQIACPNGHGWTWRTGRELLTADGSFTTLTVVFGPNLDAPFTPCPTCITWAGGQRSEPCGCDGAPWIVCPVCGHRCDLDLPTR